MQCKAVECSAVVVVAAVAGWQLACGAAVAEHAVAVAAASGTA